MSTPPLAKPFSPTVKTLFPSAVPYRFLAYSATVITGFSALCAQVIWQRHLAILVGGEARSLSLVVAVFLLGLAIGYGLFGRLTEKSLSRFWLLKIYGYVELASALYMSLFPLYFEHLKWISFRSPNLLIIDLILSFLALLAPTILMGASIPLLTAALPENPEEVHTVHSKIYGLNTLGACLGVLISGFYLIPAFGFNLSLHGIGVLNALAGTVFIGNRLKGLVHKAKEPPRLPSPLSNSFFMFFVFITGALAISFELIFVRILNLSIGAGIYNFPLVLSIFVGALALGSLSVKNRHLRISSLSRQLLFILFFLQVLFLSAPYWSIWLHHIRISLVTIPSNHIIYYILIYLFLLLFLFPAVFFMGRLLPLAYSFLRKTKSNYGKVCGWLYFFNTLGTAFGAIAIGYLAFYWFNVDVIFKANIYALFLLTLAVLAYTKNKNQMAVLFVLGVTLVTLPSQWDRTGHEVGYFRGTSYDPKKHFRGLFFLPKNRSQESRIGFFKDGPNTTVSVINFGTENTAKRTLSKLKELFSADFKKQLSYSLIVNGKSDGNTLGDFSTVFFMLPYLYGPEKADLKTAFIGLGTGVSAGAYTRLEDVETIDVLEISPFVIQAVKSMPGELNFHLMKNKKIRMIRTDAFKYFTRNKKKFDIIVSEPSNPWVVGVENLYTLEFYKLVRDSLNEGGVLGQWLHTYSMNAPILEIAIKTITSVFPHSALYQVGHNDILILASTTELKKLSTEKFNRPFVKQFYSAMGVKRVEDLYLSQIFNSAELSQIAKLSKENSNSFIHPQIVYKANKALFLDSHTNLFDLKSKFQPEKQSATQKTKAFERLKHLPAEDWRKRCLFLSGFNFFCAIMSRRANVYKSLNNSQNNWQTRFSSYLALRKQGLIPYSQEAMDGFLSDILKTRNASLQSLSDYISEKVKVKNYESAKKDALAFKSQNLISETHYKNFTFDLNNIKKTHQYLEKF